MSDQTPPPTDSPRTSRTGTRYAALAAALALLVVALAAFLLLRDDDDEADLGAGLTGTAVGTEVEGDDLQVVDTVQGTGVFLETDGGPVYVRYGQDTADRFGVGTVVDVEGEVASVDDLDSDERGQVDGDLYVVAEELAVDED